MIGRNIADPALPVDKHFGVAEELSGCQRSRPPQARIAQPGWLRGVLSNRCCVPRCAALEQGSFGSDCDLLAVRYSYVCLPALVSLGIKAGRQPKTNY